MPNWCYGNVDFYGRSENIYKFIEDVKSTMNYEKSNGYRRCNMWFFLEKSGFNPDAYLKTQDTKIRPTLDGVDGDAWLKDTLVRCKSTNFRAYYCDEPYLWFDRCGIAACTVGIDSAWDLDVGLLNLISLRYNILYTFQADEVGMGLYYKGKNGILPTDPEDTVITCIYDETKDDYLPDRWCMSDNMDAVTNILDTQGYEYNVNTVEVVNTDEYPALGMYYDDENLQIGMSYDIDIS